MTIHKSAAVVSGIMPDFASAGNLHFRYGFITTADDDMVSGDTLQLVPVPKNARILNIVFKSTADLVGGTGGELGDGDSNGRFFNDISLGAANRIFTLLGACGVYSGVGFKFTQDDTIDFYLRKTSTKVPTASTFSVMVTYNLTGTIADES